jgi:hypothetical protein
MKKQTAAESIADLETRLMSAAVHRTAHVLRPYPNDCTPEALNEALASLRQQKLIHGPMREPNLTALGVETVRGTVEEAA